MSSEPPPLVPAEPIVPPRRRRPRVFSLAALMLLVATCGVVSGVVAGALREDQDQQVETIVVNAAVGAVGGLFIGGSLAATYDLGIGGLLLGIGGGLACGVVAGALSATNVDFRVTLAGAAALIGLAAIVKLGSSRIARGQSADPAAGSPFPDRKPRDPSEPRP